MLTKQVGNVEVHFGPLIIVAVGTLLYLLSLALLLILRWNKMTKAFIIGDYRSALVIGKKLLRTSEKSNKRKKPKKTRPFDEQLHFVLAVSHFSEKNYEQFLHHINALTQYRDVKEFWLSLYYLCQNDLDNAKLYYASISKSNDTLSSRTYLESMMLYVEYSIFSVLAS